MKYQDSAEEHVLHDEAQRSRQYVTNAECNVEGRTQAKKLTLTLVIPQLIEKTRLTTTINRVA